MAARRMALPCWILAVAWVRSTIAIRTGGFEKSSDLVSSRSACDFETIKDALKCGEDVIVSIIQDPSCGMGTCTVCVPQFKQWPFKCKNRQMPCPKQCEVKVKKPKECNVLTKCIAIVRAFFTGQAPLQNLDQIESGATLQRIEVIEGSDEVRNLINGNSEVLTPPLNMMLNVGVTKGNEQLNAHIPKLMEELENLASSPDIAKFFHVVNTVDPAQALRRIVQKGMKSLKVHFKKRRDVQAVGLAPSSKNRCCHRSLKVSVEGKGNYVMSKWTDVVVARKFDENTNCRCVYSARCGECDVVKVKQCSGQQPRIKSTRLPRYWAGMFGDWRRYSIRSSKSKTVSLSAPLSGDEVFTNRKVFVTTVTKEEAKGLPDVEGESVEGANNATEALDTMIEASLPNFQKMMVNEMCGQAGSRWGNFFFLFGWLKKRQCTTLLNMALYWAEYFGDVQLAQGMEPLKTRITLRGDARISAEPKWNDLAKKIAEEVEIAVEPELTKLPSEVPHMSIKESHLKIDGDAQTLQVKEGSYVDVEVEIDMLKYGKGPA
jgi:hypothetical protein